MSCARSSRAANHAGRSATAASASAAACSGCRSASSATASSSLLSARPASWAMAPSRQRAAAAARRIANSARPQPCSPEATAAVARASTAACSASRRGEASSCGCGDRGDVRGGGDDGGGGGKRPWLGAHSVGSFFSALPLRERDDEGRLARCGLVPAGSCCADEGRLVRCGLVRCGPGCSRGAGCGAPRGVPIAVHSSRGAGRVGGTSCTPSHAPSASFVALSYAASARSGCLAWGDAQRAGSRVQLGRWVQLGTQGREVRAAPGRRGSAGWVGSNCAVWVGSKCAAGSA